MFQQTVLSDLTCRSKDTADLTLSILHTVRTFKRITLLTVHLLKKGMTDAASGTKSEEKVTPHISDPEF